jgi:hypothetical protein
MNCHAVQDSLLQAEDLRPESWSVDVCEHLRTCPACSTFVSDLRQLETAWKEIPVPAECEEGKAAFLQQLPTLEAAPKPTRRWRPARWVAAAALLLGVGLLSWLLVPGDVHASSDLVGRLVDLNLELANADPADRQRLLAEHEAGFREELAQNSLNTDDRKEAEQLLETAQKLVVSNDPVAETALLTGVAESLVSRIDKAEKKGSVKETQRNARFHTKVVEHGVKPRMERIARAPKMMEKEKQDRLQHIIHNDQKQQQQLETLLQNAPERARPDLRKALDAHRKHPWGWHHKHKK